MCFAVVYNPFGVPPGEDDAVEWEFDIFPEWNLVPGFMRNILRAAAFDFPNILPPRSPIRTLFSSLLQV